MDPKPIVVSVCCITYNHENFIRQAIEGFLMQKTNFLFEIIISDDCSTDNNREIINTYIEQHPGKIRLLTSATNTGSHKNMIRCIGAAKGSYIAKCEGDDYWSDPDKLQKQVDFLKRNPNYVICCHYTRVIDVKGNTIHVEPDPKPLKYSFLDLLIGKQVETKTATILYRNTPAVNKIFSEPWYLSCFAGDKFFKLWATRNTGLSIYVMPEVMSCYRNHPGGIWSMIDDKVRLKMMISDFNLIIRLFTYPEAYKKKLMLLYLRRYLLFEIMNKDFKKAFQTIKYLA
ncbi:glycosyltransferase involved in cell wall biosynthesis [Mucilaginibacter yixingensis]|uniref:Glycosyltransferase involved in cell wall biosynthesis n=1 Tax=Mucilaginibacter yixingensis TaxID=1295612 RepID=A0A2T5J9F0_9SPHI|nr:glycosyltransferase [Mucilaginibacter yixingensis]PTQ96686.1 glycosyltransferase involved in cell wall biosynthesis [Mucilaginibacter yixingensis]